jgi:hypothetical protein
MRFVFRKKIFIAYPVMLAVHVAHVVEEVLGRFWLLNLLALEPFIAVNCALFAIPVFCSISF